MNRRLAVVAVLACVAGVLAPVGAAVGTSAAAAAPASRGWSALPVAARAPIAAAIGRDERTSAAIPVNQSILTATGEAANDNFGDAVAVSGTTIVVGSPFHTVGSNVQQGAAYVFTRPATGWKNAQQSAVLTVSAGMAHDRFGFSVAMQGSTIVVGAVLATIGKNAAQGAVYVYNRPAPGWRTTSKPTAVLTVGTGSADDGLGSSVAISGDTIVAGAPDTATFTGAAYVFTKPTAGWKTTADPTADLTRFGGMTFDEFGGAVAVSGATIVVGASGQTDDTGFAYVFVKPTGGPWVSTANAQQLAGDDAVDNDFGVAVAVSGKTVVVGATEHTVGDMADAGAAYVFEQPAAGWGDVSSEPVPDSAVLTSSNPGKNDDLGDPVVLSGSTVLVGVEGANEGQGAIYSFAEPAGGWADKTQTAVLVAAGGQAGDSFGSALAVSGTTIVVGASRRTAEAGAAYAFAPPAPAMSKVKQAHKSWRLGKKPVKVNPAHKPSGGTSFSFSLSQAAKASLAFTEKVRGHVVKKGTFVASGRAGVNKVFVDGKIGHGKKLLVGHCVVTITATNANGSSRSTRLRFVVLAAKKKH